MRYIIDVSQTQAKQLEALIREQKYESVNQFVTVAIENQLYIEKSKEAGKIFVENRPLIEKRFHDSKGFPEEEIRIFLPVPKEVPVFAAPPMFSGLYHFQSVFDEEDCWIWGQINKIFPVKLALRFLLKKIGAGQWLELDRFKDEVADLALSYRKAIEIYEEKKNKKRDDKISAGLPTGAEFTSMTRYKTHFIGDMRKNGTLDGAMPLLKFANFAKNDKGTIQIGITQAGYEFARLENPVIDLENFDESLGQSEIDFYLNHVYKNVKGEFKAIKWLLIKLAAGVVERSVLNDELKKENAKIWYVSDAVINTQRAGLMSRMSELGLIDKEKEGIQVKYLISERGKEFLRKYGQ